MKHLYHLNRWQWLGFFAWVAFMWPVITRDNSPIFTSLRFVFTITFAFLIVSGSSQSPFFSRLFSLTLIVKTTGTKEDRELFDKLHHLFKSNFPNERYVEYDGRLRGSEQLRFNFKSADADVIMESLQPLLKNTSFPPGSHFLALVGPYKTREFPIFAEA